MFTVFAIMLLGFALGYFLREKTGIGWIKRAITWLILLLLFFLGVAVGHHEAIIQNLGTIGLQALIITFGAVAGSLLCAAIVYKFFFKTAKQH